MEQNFIVLSQADLCITAEKERAVELGPEKIFGGERLRGWPQKNNKIFYDRNSVLSTTCERPLKLRGCSQIWFKSVSCKSASSELSFSGPAKFRKKGHKLTD